MPLPILPLLVAAPLLISVADGVPKYDVELACRGAVASAVTPGRTADGCKNDENEARSKLDQEWSRSAAADRERCTRTSSMGGAASYVDLLTCLDMANTAKTLPKNELSLPPASR